MVCHQPWSFRFIDALQILNIRDQRPSSKKMSPKSQRSLITSGYRTNAQSPLQRQCSNSAIDRTDSILFYEQSNRCITSCILQHIFTFPNMSDLLNTFYVNRATSNANVLNFLDQISYVLRQRPRLEIGHRSRRNRSSCFFFFILSASGLRAATDW